MPTYFQPTVRQYFNIVHLWGVGFAKLNQDCQHKGFCHWVLFCQVSRGLLFCIKVVQTLFLLSPVFINHTPQGCNADHLEVTEGFQGTYTHAWSSSSCRVRLTLIARVTSSERLLTFLTELQLKKKINTRIDS